MLRKKESHINYNKFFFQTALNANSAVNVSGSDVSMMFKGKLLHFITDNLLGKSNLRGFTPPALHVLK